MPPLESVNCLFSALLARIYLSDAEKDGICERYFTGLVDCLYDEKIKRRRMRPGGFGIGPALPACWR